MGADLIVASDLTLVECDRVMIRAQTARDLSGTRAAALRPRRPFPGEPIRTPDALHLASALVAQAALDDLAVLSLDIRIRAAAQRLGFTVLPA